MPPLKRFLRNMTSAGANVVVLPRTPMGRPRSWSGRPTTAPLRRRTTCSVPSTRSRARSSCGAPPLRTPATCTAASSRSRRARTRRGRPSCGPTAAARRQGSSTRIGPGATTCGATHATRWLAEGIADDDPDPMTFDGPNGWMRWYSTSPGSRCGSITTATARSPSANSRRRATTSRRIAAPGAGGWRQRAPVRRRGWQRRVHARRREPARRDDGNAQPRRAAGDGAAIWRRRARAAPRAAGRVCAAAARCRATRMAR